MRDLESMTVSDISPGAEERERDLDLRTLRQRNVGGPEKRDLDHPLKHTYLHTRDEIYFRTHDFAA